MGIRTLTPRKLPNRRHHVTEEVGPFQVSVGFDRHWHPCEVFVSGRGKSGTELDGWLYAMGVAASKIMQNKPLEADDLQEAA